MHLFVRRIGPHAPVVIPNGRAHCDRGAVNNWWPRARVVLVVTEMQIQIDDARALVHETNVADVRTAPLRPGESRGASVGEHEAHVETAAGSGGHHTTHKPSAVGTTIVERSEVMAARSNSAASGQLRRLDAIIPSGSVGATRPKSNRGSPRALIVLPLFTTGRSYFNARLA